MSRGKRTRVSLGVYRDRAGYSVTWQEHGKQQEVRFPLDTPIYKLKDHRERETARVAKQPKADTRHGLARDVVRYLRLRKGRPGYKAEKSHLRAWAQKYPTISRWGLTREQAHQAVADWRAEGYSAQTIKHRVKVFQRLYKALDGPRIPTPLDDVALPVVPRPRPRSVPEATVRSVAEHLKAQEEQDGRMATAKTRARYLVLASTGQRPAQLMKAAPADVDLEQRIWFVEPAKGDRGTIVYLNDDMLGAWQLFATANAWGPFNGRSFVRTLQRAGWPKGIRPYNLRHTVGLSLSALGVDLADISAHMGHSSTDVTRQFYVPALFSRLKAASELLDGRLAGLSGPAAVPDSGAMKRPRTKQKKTESGAITQESRLAPSHGTRRSKGRKVA